MLPILPSIQEELNAFIQAPALPMTSGVQLYLTIHLIIYLIILCLLLIPKLYLYRLVTYRIMDNEPCNGLQAVLHSRLLMMGHRRKLFLLDLSFWWFYLLELVISAVSVGYLILPGLGIALPFTAEAAGWIFPIAAILARLALYWLTKPKLAITYALFYQRVCDESRKEPEPPKPKRMPWKY